MDSKQKIRAFIVENFYVPESTSLADDTSLIESGIVDSTGVLEVVAFLEKAFDIAIPDRRHDPREPRHDRPHRGLRRGYLRMRRSFSMISACASPTVLIVATRRATFGSSAGTRSRSTNARTNACVGTTPGMPQRRRTTVDT